MAQAEVELDLTAALAAVTAVGQPFEVISTEIDGAEFRVFKNAPGNLRTLYESGLLRIASGKIYKRGLRDAALKESRERPSADKQLNSQQKER